MDSKKIHFLLFFVFLIISVPALTDTFSSSGMSSGVPDSTHGNLFYGPRLDYGGTPVREDELRLHVSSRMEYAESLGKTSSYAEMMDVGAELLGLELTAGERARAARIYSYAGLRHAVSVLNNDKYDFLKARSVLEQVRPYASDTISDDINRMLQKTYISEGAYHMLHSNFDKGAEALQKGYDVSDDGKQRLEILYNIAAINENTGFFDREIECYDRVLALARSLGSDTYMYKSLMAERRLCKELNDMEKFAKLGVSLDSLMSVTDNRKILADYYSRLGDEYLALRDFAMAESYFGLLKSYIDKEPDEALRSKVLAATYYNKMRDLKRSQHDYEGAIRYSTMLRQYYAENVAQGSHLQYLVYLFDTQLYSEMKDTASFERCCDTLFNVYHLMPNAYTRGLIYDFCGAGYSKLGMPHKALAYFLKADSVLARRYDEAFDLRLRVRKLIANEYEHMGRYDEACREYRRYAEITGATYGTKSERYTEAVYSLANAEQLNGNLEESAMHYSESMNILIDILRTQLRYVNTTDRTGYLVSLSRRMWDMSSFALKYSGVDSKFVKLCYNSILVLKSLLFESDRSMYNTLQLKGTREDVNDFVRMSFLRSRQKELFRDYKKNKEKIDSISRTIRLLDNKLTDKSRAYKEYTSFLDFTCEDVCEQLDSNDVLIDFYDYESGGTRKYVAFVVKKDSRTPVIIDMFRENRIDSITGDIGMDVLYSPSMSEQVRMIWDKLRPYATPGGRVYYVPSGVMFQIALGSLPLSDGSLLGEHYSFVRLSSARNIEKSRMPLGSGRKAVVYGGLDYDHVDADSCGNSRMAEINRLSVMRAIPGINDKFDFLPETVGETEKISSILRSSGYDVRHYTGTEGTGGTFLGMHNNSPQILHIATHGFYYTPEEAGRNRYLRGRTDAMMLSGLVLSGGNGAWTGISRGETAFGSILTASSIACLDLSNIELVVLSACRTGMGHVTREGLLGLQRAFKKAGAGTVVMSLWDVSDVVTRRFMTEFYKNLFERGCDRRTAFAKAKKTIRRRYPEPLYWASFIMVD